MQDGRLRQLLEVWALTLGRPRQLLEACETPAVGAALHRAFSWLLLAVVAAVALPDVVLAGWLAANAGPWLGLQALLRFVQEALGATFLAYVVAWGALWLAGPARQRASAAVAAQVVAMPVGIVTLGQGILRALAPTDWPIHATWIKGMVTPLQWLGLAWAMVLLVLAMAWRRRAPVGEPTTSPPGLRVTWGGRALLGLLVVAIAVQAGQLWSRRAVLATAERFDAVGELASIGAQGALGATVAQAQAAALTATPARGHAKVVEVWATWCGPCRASLPHVAAFAAARPDLPVVLVNIDDPRQAARLVAALPSRPANLVSAYDTTQFAERLGATTLPTFAVYDEGGHLIDLWSGFDQARMARGVSAARAP